MIDRVCGYRPGFKAHSPHCDTRAHEALAADVATAVDPPIFRAVAGDHELCAIYPCDDCQGNRPVLVST